MVRDSAPLSVEELLAQSGWLRRLAATLVAGEAAEDLVQETWLVALQNPPRAGSLRPWLARIARNLSSNFRRGEARRKEYEARASEPGPELDPGTALEEVEAQRVLVEAVLRLDEPLRTAVVLRYLRGLDSSAIGRQQGVPAGTVRWRLKRALEVLRADLDGRFGERRSWCSALAVLLPDGAGASLTTGATLANATVTLGATIALGAAGFLALVGTWWITAASGTRRAEPLLGQDTLELGRAEEDFELEPPAEVDGSPSPARNARVQPASSTTSAEDRSARSRQPIRGRLLIDGTGEVLDEALTIRLRTGDMSVKEKVQSAADGSFRTKRPFPHGFVMAEVLNPSNGAIIECEARFDPTAPEEWALPVPWPNYVHGRLVDRAGRPLETVEVLLFQGKTEMDPTRDGHWGDGRFSFSDLGREPCTVIARRGFERHEFTMPIARGPNELGDHVVPFREVAGEIRCRLRAADGNVGGKLVLTELVTGVTYENWAGAEFVFEDLPQGNYRLTLLPSDGLRYASTTRFVRPPCTDIEFVATGELEPFVFRALDGENEIVVLDKRLVVHAGRPESRAELLVSGQWCYPDVSCEPSDVERWILLVAGYRPASGRTPESTRIEARLEPGWGCALHFRESSGGQYAQVKGPLEGVEVRADGILVARSDQDGLALLSLPRKPDELECSLAGWAMEDDEVEAVLRKGELSASAAMWRE